MATASYNNSSDNLFNGYSFSGGGEDFQFQITLPPGNYDVFAFNDSVYTTTFTLSLGNIQLGSGSASSASPMVQFPAVSLPFGATLTLNSSSGDQPVRNGLQISCH
jgi:hypothetical protein